MRELVEVAKTIAENVHEEQTDLQGQPYIDHVRRVAESQPTEIGQILGWLHDAIEDGGLTVKTLTDAGVPLPIALRVQLLSRRHKEPYANYIGRLIASGSKKALRVKIADMRDNMRDGCPKGLLEDRYKRQLPRLEAALSLLEEQASAAV